MHSVAIAYPPLLREGDRLDSREFLRRWEAMPDLKQAELIDGVVYLMPSPVSRAHSVIHYGVTNWLSHYSAVTPGCEGGLEGTWVMGVGDVPQPDISLRILPECGGQSRDVGDYVAGAPELVIEVCGSSLSRDLGTKLDLYRRSGVREYLTVLLNPRQVVWRTLSRGKYQEIEPGEDGLLRSKIFPGLWLDPDALWNKKKSLRAAVELGVRSAEHAAFVKKLAAARRRK
ncbi:MAG: Uma2 family endonuclease [Acidobacteria bacterium]|nr:Uma2 family endonuclease [Acidobacteriota bacterium]